jgi:hypothetical protein
VRLTEADGNINDSVGVVLADQVVESTVLLVLTEGVAAFVLDIVGVVLPDPVPVLLAVSVGAALVIEFDCSRREYDDVGVLEN